MEEIEGEEVQPSSSKDPSIVSTTLHLLDIPNSPNSSINITSPVRITPTIEPPIQSPQRQGSLTRSVISALEKVSNRSHKSQQSQKNQKSIRPEQVRQDIAQKVSNLEPKSADISDHINELTDTVKLLSKGIADQHSPAVVSNVDKIATVSQILTKEAKALRQSIKSLTEDIVKSKKEVCKCGPLIDQEDVSFPYHLFLIELIINKIHMKCECFDFDYNNLIISASFLGKQPIVLYDATYGKIDNFTKLNVGKSTLFAMTYDKICSIKEFEVVIELTKQPPCSSCVSRIGETHMDYTNEFIELREELCKKWTQEQPKDNIMCTTSTPLSKNMYYISCGDIDHQDSIGIIEVTVRMSFLGKEITTAFTACPKPHGTTLLCQEDNGMAMYSCQKVEMDEQGKVLLDEDVLNKKSTPCYPRSLPMRGSDSLRSQLSTIVSSKRSYGPVQYSNYNYYEEGIPKYDEISTTINANELKIKVPKSTKVERMGKYDKIQELCTCEANPYSTGDQIQLAMPPDLCGPEKSHKRYTANLKYTYNGCNRTCDTKNRKIINVTPTNCPVPVAMEKMAHPLKDVFILKIGKKLETKDKKTDLEIELVTPKAPKDSQEIALSDVAQQSSVSDLKKLKSKGKKKDGKKGGKAKKKEKKKWNLN